MLWNFGAPGEPPVDEAIEDDEGEGGDQGHHCQVAHLKSTEYCKLVLASL